jgi:choline dehydrogenase-like flavoprotein
MSKRSIVVIGGGLAGSLICNELVRDADVTLLEIGQKDSIHYPDVGYDKKELGHVKTFCFGGGGTTNLWHNGLIPINPDDVASQDFRDVLAAARPFINDAATRLFFKGDYSSVYREAVSEATTIAANAGIAADGVDCLIYPKKFHRLTVDSRVHDVYGVDRIRFEFAGRKITRVSYAIGSREHSLDADIVIVASGAMGSPKILRDIVEASGRKFAGLGTGFIDHPLGFVGKVRFKRGTTDAIDRLSMWDCGDYVIRSALRLKSECGRYTCCVFLRPALTIHNSLSIYKYKSLLGATTGLTRARNALSWKLFHPDILAEVFSHVMGVNIPSRTYNVLFVGEQRPGRSRVYYDGDTLRVDWSISDEELSIYRALLRKLCDILGGVAERVNVETTLTDEWLWSGAHHSCTTPLGDAPDGLIGANLKLKFCDNVYVCDGSVIQEHSYANTGLTIGQLALCLANNISSAR